MAVTAAFDKGLLQISADESDSVEVTVEKGRVKINGQDPEFGSLTADAVTALRVDGSHSNPDGIKLDAVSYKDLPNVSEAFVTTPSGVGVDMLLVEKYAETLGGKNWSKESGYTLEMVQHEIVAGTWREAVSNSSLPIAAKEFGVEAFQGWVDSKLEAAGLRSMDISKLEWFQIADDVGGSSRQRLAPLSSEEGPLDYFDFVPGPLMLLSGGEGVDNGYGIATILGHAGPTDGGEGGTLTVTSAEAVESDDVMYFEIHMNAEYIEGFDVDWTTEQASATVGDDYTGQHGIYHWGDTAEGAAGWLEVPIHDDELVESDEEFFVVLSNPRVTEDGVDGGEGQPIVGEPGKGIIRDNDSGLAVRVSDEAFSEGQGTQHLTVALAAPAPEDITIEWELVDGTAELGDDYDAPATSGTVTILEGQIQALIEFDILDDEDEEDDEFFFLNIGNPFAATTSPYIATGQGKITIRRSDAPVEVSISDGSEVEGDPALGLDPDEGDRFVSFTISLSSPQLYPVTVNYATEDGTALSTTDYVEIASGSVIFAPLETSKVIQVEIKRDDFTEFDEHFYVNLSLPIATPPEVVIADGQGRGEIFDDDFLDFIPDLLPPCECDCSGTIFVPSSSDGSVNVQQPLSSDKSDPQNINHQSNSNPHPIVVAEMVLPESPFAGKTLYGAQARVVFNGDVQPGSVFYTAREGMEAGDTMRFVRQLELAPDLDTGTYDVEMQIVFLFVDPQIEEPVEEDYSAATSRLMTRVSVVNRRESPFGNRWWLNELDYLVVTGRDQYVTVVRGDGNTLAFSGPEMTPPPGHFEVLEYADEQYTLSMPDGTSQTFDGPSGLLLSRTDRNGNQTLYDYDEDGRLITITDPLGRVTTFEYENPDGRLSKFIDYAGRETLVEMTDGALTEITYADPDAPSTGIAPSVATFAYDDETLLLESFTTINGETTELVYDEFRMLTQVKHMQTTVTTEDITPSQRYGIFAPNSIETPVDIPAVQEEPGLTLNELNQETKFQTDRFGRVTRSTDALENTTLFERDANGLVTTMTTEDPDGAGPRAGTVVHYTYDDRGRLLTEQVEGYAEKTWTYDETTGQVTSFIDELGRTTLYTLDEAGNVLFEQHVVGTPDDLEVAIVDDVVWAYTYTSFLDGVPAGLLKSVIDPEDHTTEYRYYGMDVEDTDATLLGVLKSVTFAVGEAEEGTVAYAYETVTRNLLGVTDEIGRETNYEYDNLGRVIKMIEADPDDDGPLTRPEWLYGYCACGRLVSTTDPDGKVTSYEYDERDRLFKVILPKPEVTDPERPFWQYEYYDNELLRYATDPNGNLTEYLYDAAGRLTHIIEPDPDGEGELDSPEWIYAYDNLGLVTAVTDPEGRTTNFAYDARMRQIEVKLPEPTLGAGRPTYTYEYDDADQLLAVNEPEGRTTAYVYHEDLGWLLDVMLPDPDGSSETDDDQPVWNYAYDKLGNVTSVTNPRGKTTEYGYDARYRLTSVIQPPAASLADPPIWLYEYDLAGQLIAATDPMLRETNYEYDFLGRLKQVTAPDPDGPADLIEETGLLEAAVTIYGYDKLGRVTSVENGLDETTLYGYDALGRRTSVTDPLGKVTSLEYDFNGNLLSLTDPESNETTWVYDALDRATSETNQLNDARTFEYDLSGNLTKKTDRLGRVTRYEYDALDRLRAERWFEDDEALSPLHTLNYDYDLAGRLESASDTVAEYDYAYDRLDQVTGLTTNLAGLADEVVMTSVYDLAGNRTKLSTTIDATADLVNDYVYDDLNRLKQVKQHGVTPGNAVAQKRVDFSYHLDGQFDQIKRYDDLTATTNVIDTTYSYDLAGRMTSVGHIKSINFFFTYSREYDEANRAVHDVAFYRTSPSWPTQLDSFYNYDERGQLTSVTDGEETPTVYEDYVYDDNGNREESDSVAWDIDPNNQLRSDGVYQYEYDEEGNRTKRIELIDDEPDGETTEYLWDHRNRLTAVITKATPNGAAVHTVIYAYDVFDRKVRRDVDETGDGTSVDSRELYVYDGADVLFDFIDEDANGGDPQTLARRYLHGPAVDQVLAQEDVGDDTYWLLSDLQGSTRDIVRYDGTTTVLVEHLDYNSFGEPVIASAVTRYGYTAREYDTDTGLQYNRARWYSVTTATWMSEDPDGFRPGDPNLMRYVGNSPTNYADPSGLDPFDSMHERQWPSFEPGPAVEGANDLPESLNTGYYQVESTSEEKGMELGRRIREFADNSPFVTKDAQIGLHVVACLFPDRDPTIVIQYADGHRDIIVGAPSTGAMADQAGVITAFCAPFGAARSARVSVAPRGAATEGIYEFTAASGRQYVGQSGNIPVRVERHLHTGKLLESDLCTVQTTEVLGGKTAREIAEQLRINELGGVRNLENIRNPIGPKRQHLMPKSVPGAP